uniref:Glycosyltransferase 2-like domain-containing protein n=1 Tax=Ditylum brightwellii TaxID=49249 RepID=A0A7S1ZWM9_9STRA
MNAPFLKHREACTPLLAPATADKQKRTKRALHMSRKGKEISYLVGLFTVSTILLQLFILKNVSCTWPEDPVRSIMQIMHAEVVRSIMHAEVDVSVIILTYKKHLALAKLLPSVLQQKKCKFEIIIADNGCLEDTRKVIDGTFGDHDTDAQPRPPLKYLPLCDNPGYAKGNNAAVALASPTSERLLFLNDDIVLGSPRFIYNMVRLLKSKETAAAVGCKILNSNGTELIEAGSLIWDDASALGYGRGRTDINATEFSFTKPVDYVSGACLLVEKKVFEDYAGFDGVLFPNYYEDTDLQMHIQHDLGKEVWLEPNSVALHDEHGSFGDTDSTNLMQNAAEIFRAKWREALKDRHIANPWNRDKEQQKKSLFLASDLRARDPTKANIFFIDDKAPNKSRGSGFGRAFDNLSMISELGHRITLVTLYPPSENYWCDESCLDKIARLGIEYETRKSWEEVFQSRIGFYDVVVVSRPDTLKRTFRKLREFYGQSPFSLIYDSEALSFLRDEKQDDLVNGPTGIPFPGYGEIFMPNIRSELRHVVLKARRNTEIALLSFADTVLAVSGGEKKHISKLSPKTKDIEVIGHIMGLEHVRASGGSVSGRNGILCVASFANSMYYNGDAIWYFLKYVYPLVIAGSKLSSIRIPHLTIAGRGIPDELLKVVNANDIIAPHVTFLESPPTLDALYASNRLFISPHLYGAGIQYKVSQLEASLVFRI